MASLLWKDMEVSGAQVCYLIFYQELQPSHHLAALQVSMLQMRALTALLTPVTLRTLKNATSVMSLAHMTGPHPFVHLSISL